MILCKPVWKSHSWVRKTDAKGKQYQQCAHCGATK